MKLYTFVFYRRAEFNEIGPQPEILQSEHRTKKDALLTAKNIAAQYEWRLLHVDEAEKANVPKRLPVVQFDGKRYYQDERLREYRAVDNPHDRIAF